MPKGIGLLRKVGNKNILETITIKILCIDTHTSPSATIWIQSTVCFQGDFRKGPVTVVAKEKIWDAIVGLKDVQLPIVVVIKADHAQTFAGMFSDSRFTAHVRERAVTIVVIENARRAFKPCQVTKGPAFKEVASHFTVWIKAQIIA